MTAGIKHGRELDSGLVSTTMSVYDCGAFIAGTVAAIQT